MFKLKSITIDKNIMSGEPIFRGTRVPIKILFEYLGGGDSRYDFLEQYDSVSKEMAL